MQIFLSSGARRGYRQDVVRALAMPKGSELQLRYDRKWVSPEVIQRMQTGAVDGEGALICYVDQQDKNKKPKVIPCRFAMVRGTERAGSTACVQLSLGSHAYARDLDAFNEQVWSASGETLPRWAESGSIEGFYWLELGQEPTDVVACDDKANWEELVGQLGRCDDFSKEPFFFRVDGPFWGTERVVAGRGGVFALRGSKEYELRMYHFHPSAEPLGKTWLRLDASSTRIGFVAGNKFEIDSRYDLKLAKIRTVTGALREVCVLSVYRVDDDPAGAPAVHEFDLRAEVSGSFWRTALRGLVLGVVLGAAQVIPSLKAIGQVVTSVFALLLSVVVGMLVAFGVERGPSVLK
jgi:hypothetical protein